MQIAMMGLGRMGANLVRRLVRDGHHCVVYDRDLAAVDLLATLDGVTGARDLDDLVSRLDAPRAIWIMVPAAVVGAVVDDLSARLEPGDIIIDGGNSHYRDDIARADSLAERGIQFVDVGTSGGVFGLQRGFCLMIGGQPETVAHLDPIFATLAPGLAAAERSPCREGEASTAERGYLHCGPSGAGHFVKMVHNGIEYGLMAGYAEGLGVLAQAGIGNDGHETDAETTPLRDPRAYQYNLDVPEITELWRRGSVVASWLLDLTADALHRDPELSRFGGHVSDSGEGRWTVHAAVDEGVPTPVLSAALFARFSSRGEADFSNRVLSGMRSEFGGHAERAQ